MGNVGTLLLWKYTSLACAILAHCTHRINVPGHPCTVCSTCPCKQLAAFGTMTMSVPMYPRRSKVLKCTVDSLCILLVCHIETVSQTPALDTNFMLPPSWAVCMHLYLVIGETRL